NSRLPVLVYHQVEGARSAGACEELFARNCWLGSWVNGIFSFHHFHSTSHEVLGVVGGSASVILGGPSGRSLQVGRGAVVGVPAGIGQYNAGSSADLVGVGSDPNGMGYALRRGVPAEREEVLANIAAVPLPGTDPVHGPGGPLVELWAAG